MKILACACAQLECSDWPTIRPQAVRNEAVVQTARAESALGRHAEGHYPPLRNVALSLYARDAESGYAFSADTHHLERPLIVEALLQGLIVQIAQESWLCLGECRR